MRKKLCLCLISIGNQSKSESFVLCCNTPVLCFYAPVVWNKNSSLKMLLNGPCDFGVVPTFSANKNNSFPGKWRSYSSTTSIHSMQFRILMRLRRKSLIFFLGLMIRLQMRFQRQNLYHTLMARCLFYKFEHGMPNRWPLSSVMHVVKIAGR